MNVRASAVAATRPMMAFSVVVLPAPLRPIRATTSPGVQLERQAEQHLRPAVEGVEVPDVEKQLAFMRDRVPAVQGCVAEIGAAAPAGPRGSRPGCPRR